MMCVSPERQMSSLRKRKRSRSAGPPQSCSSPTQNARVDLSSSFNNNSTPSDNYDGEQALGPLLCTSSGGQAVCGAWPPLAA